MSQQQCSAVLLWKCLSAEDVLGKKWTRDTIFLSSDCEQAFVSCNIKGRVRSGLEIRRPEIACPGAAEGHVRHELPHCVHDAAAAVRPREAGHSLIRDGNGMQY